VDILPVILAKNLFFCYGVKRALKITSNSIKTCKMSIYTFGPLIHNPQVVRDLEGKGVKAVNNLRGIKEGILIIPAHGIAPQIINEAKAKGLRLIDATCPYVQRVKDLAKSLKDEGYQVIIVGDQGHPEVEGILGFIKEKAVVLTKSSQIRPAKIAKKVGVVAQTTQTLDNFQTIVRNLLKFTKELKVYNTICEETIKRQTSARRIAKVVDLMLVIGGKNSANTNRLAKICQEEVKTYHIEEAKELKAGWLKGKKRIGIAAGASTPDWIVKEVVNKVRSGK